MIDETEMEIGNDFKRGKAQIIMNEGLKREAVQRTFKSKVGVQTQVMDGLDEGCGRRKGKNFTCKKEKDGKEESMSHWVEMKEKMNTF